ncbi:hypothetical protein M501DRAFT_48252 [Patellaria atrata CBS 101060]|uniref:Uncharacterized protein n=1 Tax=Patellaria atrata CBS 101060 TaxID=1346257 RepID=A0A9P4VTC7_9PEZI|nr:hypothetical protein M501DRAFT_48252 [Patellaria atrata CBS 101060]
MGNTGSVPSERHPHRLSKPRTNTNAKFSASRSDLQVYVNNDESEIIPEHGLQVVDREYTEIRYGVPQPRSRMRMSLDNLVREERDGDGLNRPAKRSEQRMSLPVSTHSMFSQSPSVRGSTSKISTSHCGSKLSLVPEDSPVDVATALSVIDRLRRTASPEDLDTIRQALQPESSPIERSQSTCTQPDEPLQNSAIALIRRRSLATPGIATRGPPVDQLRRFASSSNSSSPVIPSNTWGSEHLNTFPSQVDTRSNPWITELSNTLPPFQVDVSAVENEEEELPQNRAQTPGDMAYSHLGALRLGSLMITNGTASPEPSIISRRLASRCSNLETPEDEDADFKWYSKLYSGSYHQLERQFLNPSQSHPYLREQALDSRRILSEPSERYPIGGGVTPTFARTQTKPIQAQESPTQSASLIAKEYIAELPTSPFSFTGFATEDITPEHTTTRTIDNSGYSSGASLRGLYSNNYPQANRSRVWDDFEDLGYCEDITTYVEDNIPRIERTVTEVPLHSIPLNTQKTPEVETPKSKPLGLRQIRSLIWKKPPAETLQSPTLTDNMHQSSDNIEKALVVDDTPKRRKLKKARSCSAQPPIKEKDVPSQTKNIPTIPVDVATNFWNRTSRFESRSNTHRGLPGEDSRRSLDITSFQEPRSDSSLHTHSTRQQSPPRLSRRHTMYPPSAPRRTPSTMYDDVGQSTKSADHSRPYHYQDNHDVVSTRGIVYSVPTANNSITSRSSATYASREFPRSQSMVDIENTSSKPALQSAFMGPENVVESGHRLSLPKSLTPHSRLGKDSGYINYSRRQSPAGDGVEGVRANSLTSIHSHGNNPSKAEFNQSSTPRLQSSSIDMREEPGQPDWTKFSAHWRGRRKSIAQNLRPARKSSFTQTEPATSVPVARHSARVHTTLQQDKSSSLVISRVMGPAHCSTQSLVSPSESKYQVPVSTTLNMKALSGNLAHGPTLEPDRYGGGLKYGYESEYRLGDSVGTSCVDSRASGKSGAHIPQGLDLSGIPVMAVRR